MSIKTIEILTPVGRLVQGDCFEPRTTDSEGKPLLVKNGVNAGKPRVDYFMAIAIPKTDAGWPGLWETIKQVAITSFPHLASHIQPLASPADIGQLEFAFKVTDGDSAHPNKKGIAPNSRTGFPGHWILGFSGGFAPKCYTAGGDELINDPSMIKRGYYIRIYGSVKGNESLQQPGVYLNHSMVEFVAYGEEIITGPDGNAVFGSAPAGALPAGASATPMAPATPMAQPGAGAAPQAATPAPAAAQPAPNNVQPAPDFLNPQGAAPASVEVKYFDANGAGPFTEAQLIQAGYTPEMLATLQRV